MNCLAFDVGGAHVKFSDGLERTGSVPLALWKSPDQLAGLLRSIIGSTAECTAVGVTMTGELADCYPSKSAGVRHILASVCEAAAGLPVHVYLVDGRLVGPELAAAEPMLAAASNWHVLARLAARYVPAGAALLLDIGSTTCDVIPLAGELVYTGIERSPVCAVVGQVPYRGGMCPVAQELFATMRDVYLVLGELPEQPEDRETADGRPATRIAAVARLGRMICADETEFGEPDAIALSAAVAEAQAELVQTAMSRAVRSGWDLPLVLSGHGGFLAQRVLSKLGHTGPVIALADRLGAAVSRAAPAYALAVLVREECGR